MAPLIPIIAFFLIWLFWVKSSSLTDRRESFIFACVTWGFLVLIGTEGLSSFHLIQRGPLAVFWSLVVVVFGFLLFLKRNTVSKKDIKGGGQATEKLSSLERLTLFLGVLIVLLVAITAWMGAPNNWDSLVYHMSRVAHWAQNHTVDHYPTGTKRQIYFPPWAGFGILQFQVLAGTDRFANFIQWFAMVGCAVVVSAIAGLLGVPRLWQFMAAFFSLTIPMGILQGATTQTDYIAGFWAVCSVYFCFCWNRFPTSKTAMVLGLSTGLAILTKGTTVFYMAPFLLGFLWQSVKGLKFKGLGFAIVVGLIALSVNLPHLSRNFAVSGNILGEPDEYCFLETESKTLGHFFSNVIRNTALHLGTAISPLNRFMEDVIEQGHRVFNVPILDPHTTFGADRFGIPVCLHEDGAGNFSHLMLGMITYGIFFILWKKWSPDVRFYGLCVLAAGALFSLLLKWQPYNSRLHLPLFVMTMPFIAVVLSRSRWNQKMVVLFIVIFLFVTAVPYVVRNSLRRLYSQKKSTVFNTPRIKQYFANEITYFEPYDKSVEFVTSSGCRQVGLMLADNSWEYPFWALFGQKKDKPVRLEHVNTRPPTPAYPLGPFHPCAVIACGRGTDFEKLQVDNRYFVKKWEKENVEVYLAE